MRTSYQKTLVVILISLFAISACKKNDDSLLLLEISPSGDTPFIKTEASQIEFNFSLLNDSGQPSTTFNQGENFVFSFAFKNLSEDTIKVTTEFINSDFFRVYSALDQTDLGTPWTGIWCLYNLSPHNIILTPGENFHLTCPWIKTVNNEAVYPLCMAESKNPPDTGNYYTAFNLDFHYSAHNKTTVLNSIRFKIGFRVI